MFGIAMNIGGVGTFPKPAGLTPLGTELFTAVLGAAALGSATTCCGWGDASALTGLLAPILRLSMFGIAMNIGGGGTFPKPAGLTPLGTELFTAALGMAVLGSA